MREIWLRFVIWADTPLFFKRMRWVSIAVAGLVLVLQEKAPELNIVIHIVNKGEPYQDIVRLFPVLLGIAGGLGFAANLALDEAAKREMQRELSKSRQNQANEPAGPPPKE
jgi:hypothetical protein